jgi:hypothetical protein
MCFGTTSSSVSGGPEVSEWSAQRLQVLALASIVTALPFLAVEFVPATDLPQHLAQIRVLEELWGLVQGNLDTSHLVARPFGSNTLVYWPMLLLSRVLPTVLVGKLTVLGLTQAGVVALHRLARLRDRSPWLALVASSLTFNLSLGWGFLNFLTGLPIFLWFLPFALRRSTPWTGRDWLWGALAGCSLYWAHVLWLPWAGLALLVGQLQTPRDLRGYLLRGASLLPAFALLVAELPSMVEARSRFNTGAHYLQPILTRLAQDWLVETAFGVLGGWVDGLATAFVLGLVAVLAGVAFNQRHQAPSEEGEGRWDPSLAALAGVLSAFALFAPDMYMNTICFGRRFLPLGIMLLLLAVPITRPRLVGALSVAFTCSFSLLMTVCWTLYDQDELAGLRETLRHEPPPKSVLGLNLRGNRSVVATNPFLQTVAYFQAVHGSEVNFSFTSHGSSIVSQVGPLALNFNPSLDWYPERYTQADVAAFQCVLVNGFEDQHAEFCKASGFTPQPDAGYFRLYCRN